MPANFNVSSVLGETGTPAPCLAIDARLRRIAGALLGGSRSAWDDAWDEIEQRFEQAMRGPRSFGKADEG
jgi:hypothetical protein